MADVVGDCMTPFYWFQLTLAVLGLTLYLMVLISLVVRRTYRQSPFFVIAISLGVSDVLMICHSYACNNFRQWGILTAPLFIHYPHGPLKIWTMVGMFYFAYSQSFGSLILVGNRFTALAHPMAHQGLWHTFLTRALVVQWALPAVIVAPILFTTDIIVVPNDNGTTYSSSIFFTDNDVFKAYLVSSFVWSLLTIVISAVGYIAAFYSAFKLRRRAQEQLRRRGDDVKRKAFSKESHSVLLELKLTMCGVVIVLINLALATFLLTCIILFDGKTEGVNWIFYLLSDLLNYHNPIILLWVSERVREDFTAVYSPACISPK